MKKILLFISLLLPLLMISQEKKEKLKGNKIVELKTQTVEEFTSIEIGDMFEVKLVLKTTPTVSVDADSNFHEFITVKVIDGKLEINALKQFVRYERLFLEIGVNSKLANIFAKGKVKLMSSDKLIFEKINVESFENAKVELGLHSKNVSLYAKDKSEIKANTVGEMLSINITDSAEMTIAAEIKNSSVLQSAKSKLVLTGKCENSICQVSGDAFLDSSGFVSGISNFNASENADSYINIADKLTLEVAGKTNTYILGNPLINLQNFKESASIHKTNKAPSTLKSFLK